MIFSGVLTAVEGRRSFEQMSLGRFAGWGAVGGLLLGGVFTLLAGSTVMVAAPFFALAGAGSAAGSLALARKAADPSMLDVGADSSGGYLER